MEARAHVIVRGRVQGVYFRVATAEAARPLGLSGWVRNAGSDVEAVFEGPRASIDHMIAWCHEGPARASVESVQVEWEEPEGLTGFGIRH